MDVSTETIIRQLQKTSGDIAATFDRLHPNELRIFAEEMAYAYGVLLHTLNREDQTRVSDADYLSGLIYWTGLNTLLSAMDLLRRGYHKEPLMLLRDATEIFSAGYDLHVNPQKLGAIQTYPQTFDSRKSVSVASKALPIIGRNYGLLSEGFTHVSGVHITPHHPEPFCIGGLYNPADQQSTKLAMLMLVTGTHPLTSLIEVTFYNDIATPRHWERDGSTAIYNPKPELRADIDKLLEQLEAALKAN